MHQAKGWNGKRSLCCLLMREMFPSKKTVEEQGDSEERRLFYVAVTRAEDRSTLCTDGAPAARWRDPLLDPSRFIEEIPDEFLVEEKGFSRDV